MNGDQILSKENFLRAVEANDYPMGYLEWQGFASRKLRNLGDPNGADIISNSVSFADAVNSLNIEQLGDIGI